MADAADLKSATLKGVGVRVPSWAHPSYRSPCYPFPHSPLSKLDKNSLFYCMFPLIPVRLHSFPQEKGNEWGTRVTDGERKGNELANLTHNRIENLKESGRYPDGLVAGLNLLAKVKADGSLSRSWVQRIQVDGKRRDLGLGRYPDVGLATARERARENRQRVATGQDPISGRGFTEAEKPKPQPVKKPSTPTFESEALDYFDENKGARWTNEKNIANWLNRCKRHLFPSIGDMPVSEIKSVHLLDVIVPLQQSKPEEAKRVKQIARQVFGRCHARGLIRSNPTVSLNFAIPPRRKRVENMKSLHYSDVADALDRIDDSKAYDLTKLAIRFMTLTATRGIETRGAMWSEIDTDNAVWRIPAERMKLRKDYVIPLSTQAIEILEKAYSYSWSSPYVFPSVMSDGKPLSENAMPKLFKELEIGCVPHGMRSSFRVWCEEQTDVKVSWGAMELSLAHAIGSETERAYQRSDLLDQRRPLMQAWADYLAA